MTPLQLRMLLLAAVLLVLLPAASGGMLRPRCQVSAVSGIVTSGETTSVFPTGGPVKVTPGAPLTITLSIDLPSERCAAAFWVSWQSLTGNELLRITMAESTPVGLVLRGTPAERALEDTLIFEVHDQLDGVQAIVQLALQVEGGEP